MNIKITELLGIIFLQLYTFKIVPLLLLYRDYQRNENIPAPTNKGVIIVAICIIIIIHYIYILGERLQEGIHEGFMRKAIWVNPSHLRQLTEGRFLISSEQLLHLNHIGEGT